MPHRFDECFQNFTDTCLFISNTSFFQTWQSKDSSLVYENEWSGVEAAPLASSYWFLLSARSQLAHRCRCRNHLSTITPNTVVLSRSPAREPVTQSNPQALLLPDTVYFSTTLSSVYPYQIRRDLKKLFAQNSETNGNGNMSRLSDKFFCTPANYESFSLDADKNVQSRNKFGRAVLILM